jgi:hypothetical protein
MNNIDFWVQLGASYFLAAIMVAAITSVLLGMGLMRLIDRSHINALKEQKKRADDRLKELDYQTAVLTRAVADIQVHQAGMAKALAANDLGAIRPHFDRIVSGIGSIATANSVAKRIAGRVDASTIS